ncbi:DEAD/DEAH box helicase family protein [Elizabethkingia miricola]|uniref:DEAD/DEAH box helicase family protein n=2 Tax=Elizabethkingia miricola TaxID=172045 RepID=UPI000B35EEE1|nr:DEAD/DEAH box helicase family protein [Elizabethkingia miricola]NHQ65851.1 DEAD/DEAH box helicase family protein [Elizabethkingia miricola]NHQ69564.1 DEAD/DEAH box helicase family protein [Elizabethkingia miricola]NHQ78034.1 DEAD/DEAH box helicase family protein [Elizabethkingia miricola]PSL88493.1 restriction endonuclease subunit R [Elizabethkingia miricola]QHQ86515.1 DEAD/DEAH box helicase [Elizabethkingia miricola]
MVDMKEFPEGILFRYSWRKYQKQFLDNLQDYLSDNHLHIVAPPGSGKTVLGLEIMLRINNPTLIVAPTLAIRNQWAQRFRELFLQSDTLPEWISFDLNKPAFVTLATYQGIHSVIKRDAESKTVEKKLNNDSFLKLIKKLKIGTLILDEAHHLKNAWWQSIITIKDQLNPIVVALTATQPFDVSESEWQNYIELNGSVDAEISVPELMLEGDLCPHQDLIYFTLPTLEEKLSIDQIYQYADNLYKEIKQDGVIIEAIVNHYIYKDPEKHLEWIYDNVSSYTSGLIFMNAIGIKIADIHFQIIGDEQKYIPEFDFFWLEELLEFYLFTDDIHFKKYEDSRQAIENRLKRNSILKNKTISFFQNEKLEHILNAGSGKLEAIRNITISESENFGNDLRMVILTDFIRKEFIANDIEPTPNPDKMGVVPIFEILKNDPLVGKDIGVLTGSLVILPRELANQLVKDFPDKDVSLSEMKSDGNFVQIYPKDNNQSFLVEIVTHFFQEGRINILIGTKSLLGEGWDAPKINSLIVASFVSSYVLSNQIRGRAIRTDKDNPEKVSNIWHLICFNERDPEGGMDYQKMVKRFKTFVGVSNRENEQIENNIERLNIKTIEKISEIKEINKEMISLARRKNELKDKWNRALKKGDHLVEEIQIESQDPDKWQEKKFKSLSKSIGHFMGMLISSVLMFWAEFLGGIIKSLKSFQTLEGAYLFIFLFGIAGFLTYGGMFYRSLMQYLRYKNISKNLEKIARAILSSLISERAIRTSNEKLKIVVSLDERGNSICHLEGGSYSEASIFILTLQELLSKIDNPRYLLKTKGILFLKNSINYYPVPDIFGRNKKSAELFARNWIEESGAASLVFTRTIEGRKLLLTLRFKALVRKNKHIEHIHKWIR